MGVGTALAMGLVQGFSKNMDEEKARRQAQRDRVDGYQNLAMEASFKDDANMAGVNAVFGMVNKARREMDSMKPIGPFGARGEDVVMDMASVQSALRKTGDERFLNIGSYKVQMSDEISFRHKKDRSDPSKKAMLTIDALNEHLNDPDNKSAFLKQFEGNVSNLNELRGIYRPAVQGIIAQLQQENKGKPVDPRTAITNYSFFSDLLGLGIDGQQQIAIDSVKAGSLPILNRGLSPDDEGFVTEAGVTVVSSSLYPDTPSDSGYQAIPIASFTENDIDIGLVDMAAKSQGRSRGVFLSNFSSQYNSMTEFMTGLRHATTIAEMTRSGEKLSFSDNETLINVGNYLDTTEGLRTDAIGQTRIIQGLMGPVLTESQRRSLANGTATPDTFRTGTNPTEAYKMTFGEGNSLSDFKTRVRSAQIAKEQLNIYKTIVGNEINTVKGTMLDSALKAVNSLFGTGGTTDQLLGMLGTMDDAEKQKISARLEGIKNRGGARARRDTLAFIIAANMARAEDQGGRLSDGDIQRNLDKLAPGLTTKPGEIQSVDTVIESVDQQLRLLQKYDNIIEVEGANGFSIATREKIQALKVRDLALKRSRDTNVTATSSVNQMSYEEASKLEPSTVFPTTNPSYSVVTDGKGSLIILDAQNGTVVARGKPGELTERGLITTSRTPTGNQTVTPPASNVNPADRPAPLDVAPVPPTPSEINAVEATDLDSPAIRSGNFYKLPGKGDALYKKIERTDGSEYYILNSQGTN